MKDKIKDNHPVKLELRSVNVSEGRKECEVY